MFCLLNQNGIWRVFYTERGLDQEPIFESPSEEEACEFLFDYITRHIQHQYLVGFFHQEQSANDLCARLEQNGILTHRDKIPYGGWIDPRFRVFVIGKDIFKVSEILDEVPVQDDNSN